MYIFHMKICASQFCYGFKIFTSCRLYPTKTKIPICITIFKITTKVNFWLDFSLKILLPITYIFSS